MRKQRKFWASPSPRLRTTGHSLARGFLTRSANSDSFRAQAKRGRCKNKILGGDFARKSRSVLVPGYVSDSQKADRPASLNNTMNTIEAPVCIIDHDITSRDTVERFLRAEGFRVECYSSA